MTNSTTEVDDLNVLMACGAKNWYESDDDNDRKWKCQWMKVKVLMKIGWNLWLQSSMTNSTTEVVDLNVLIAYRGIWGKCWTVDEEENGGMTMVQLVAKEQYDQLNHKRWMIWMCSLPVEGLLERSCHQHHLLQWVKYDQRAARLSDEQSCCCIIY